MASKERKRVKREQVLKQKQIPDAKRCIYGIENKHFHLNIKEEVN